jgi:hypothetical protein
MSAAKKAVPSLRDLTGNKDEESKSHSQINQEDNDKVTENNDSGHLEDAPIEEEENDDDNDIFLSSNVVATVPNKTPAELASESPDETAKRYNIDTSISDRDADDPRVQVYRDTHVKQVPSGTHLHPDVAKDLQNRGISEQGTDNAQVKRMFTETYDFAPDAEVNDKF